MIGTVFSHYQILEKIGSGGMGEVYRAHDSKLMRDVAIKVLSSEFGADPGRVARLRREARVLAGFNHPNIASLYALEEVGQLPALVLELVPGETLADRLERGRPPLKAGLELAVQVASAIEAAHERGVVHRDLKPSNIKITPDGIVKVLDFGLAKPTPPARPAHDSTTQSLAESGVGTVVGTPAYMSPEQARGHEVDRRADIWAFGCILFEILAGESAFARATLLDTAAAVLEGRPDSTLLPRRTPAAARRVLRRCLEPALERRLRDVADARLDLEEAIRSLEGVVPEEEREEVGALRSRRRTTAAFAAGAILLAIVAAWGLRRLERPGSPAREAPLAARFAIQTPPARLDLSGMDLSPLALSPDGGHLVYVAAGDTGPMLWSRPLGAFAGAGIPGTEGAAGPFFSPDGDWVGFVAQAKLKTVGLRGGGVKTLWPVVGARGATWCADGSIVFSPYPESGLWRIASHGGEPEAVTHLDPERGERTHRWPSDLPGGRALLFTVGTADITTFDDARIELLVCATGERRTLVEGGSCPRYVPGWILYARAGALLAVPFDPDRLEVTGEPVPVLDGVVTLPAAGTALMAVAGNRTLAYVPGGPSAARRALVMSDRSGRFRTVLDVRDAFVLARPSPDGKLLAVEKDGANATLWICDPARGTFDRLTTRWSNGGPVWTPDGRRVTFRSGHGGPLNLYWTGILGTGPIERLTTSIHNHHPDSWSPDGSVLAFTETTPQSGNDIRLLRRGSETPDTYLATPFDEAGAQFSPDGAWVAYVSNASGRVEVYVQGFPERGRRRQISSRGGIMPRWSPLGGELFYCEGRTLMSVRVRTAPDFAAEPPRRLFDLPAQELLIPTYEVMPDGERFLLIECEAPIRQAPIRVILDWQRAVTDRPAAAARRSA